MFEDALLETSLRRAPVLHRVHYLLAILAGLAGFVLGEWLLPLILIAATGRPLAIAAGLVGAVVAGYALLLCYVWVDARREGWLAWPWTSLVLLLNLPGFLTYLVYAARKTGDWRRATLPLAYAAETVLVGGLVVLPLVYTQALPRDLLISTIHISVPMGRPPSRPAVTSTQPRAPHRQADPFTAPIQIPTAVAIVHDPPAPPQTAPGPIGPYVPGVPEGLGPAGGTVPGGAFWPTTPLPPGPTQPSAPAKPQMVRVGGNVIDAKAIYQPQPTYPQIALIARIQGTVILQAILSTNGTIQDLKVLSGPPMLVRAALDAVKVWRYQPTLLNNEPVEVLTEISVIFRLDS